MRNPRPLSLILATVAILLIGSGCRSAYYAAYEKFGVHKRDILKDRVTDARDEQQEASETFKDALTRLKEMTSFDGGQLESAYQDLQSDYDDCAARADAVQNRIASMDQVAEDLFAEWEEELEEISTPSLRRDSQKKLAQTRKRYDDVRLALVRAEESMAPVLTKFKDYVLYLKHNLNAQAIASLKGEAESIQEEIRVLIDQMNASIAKADAFIGTME